MKMGLKSIRMKLFLTLTITVVVIIFFLILINNVVLETYYMYTKQNNLLRVYEKVNQYYNDNVENVDIELELEKVAISNNFDIVLKTNEDISIYSSNKNFLETLGQINTLDQSTTSKDMVYSKENVQIKSVKDSKTLAKILLLSAQLDNGYKLYIRMSVTSIQESVKISNSFLYLIGSVTILIGGVVVSIISDKYTKPILELNNIARRMANLDFSKKYQEKETDDEINNLGKSINVVSEKLEKTIKELRRTNIELEKDIEQKSKIDDMRKQFISDVSHELKTPIALIQGYAEGLAENVTADEESRKFYVEVIQDEANRMDKLVKQLLELMKLEYGKREFNNTRFDITELIREVIRKTEVMRENENIEVKYDPQESAYVYADDFFIEQVVTNYITNAIKHVDEVNGNKYIRVSVEKHDKVVRVKVYNTGEKISEEDLNRIWQRFYKVDSSRNREKGGSGIGLSLVRAIMNNYNKDFGVYNIDDGVEFFFELDLHEEI